MVCTKDKFLVHGVGKLEHVGCISSSYSSCFGDMGIGKVDN